MKDKKFLAFILPNGINAKASTDINNIELYLSFCFFINKSYQGLSQGSSERNVDHNYDTFYNGLTRLKELDISPFEFMVNDEKQDVTVSTNPLACYDSQSSVGQHQKDYDEIKNLLWQYIFMYNPLAGPAATSPKFNANSKFVDPVIDDIECFCGEDDEKLTRLSEFFRDLRGDLGVSSQPAETLQDTFEGIRAYGASRLEATARENMARENKRTDLKKEADKLLGQARALSRRVTASGAVTVGNVTGLSAPMDGMVNLLGKEDNSSDAAVGMGIEELVMSYTTISSEPVLMRLMGLIRDVKIKVDRSWIPTGDGEKIIKLSVDTGNNSDLHEVATQIKVKRIGQKVAFLVDDSQVGPTKDTFYQNSLMLRRPFNADGNLGKETKIVSCDKVSLEMRMQDMELEQMKSEDALTRGLLFVHPYLHKLVTPQNVQSFPLEGITDDYVIGGHRVGLINPLGKYYSLTRADLDVQIHNGKSNIYSCTRHEGAINFDAPIQRLSNGELKSTISDVAFEYSGELLTLKSAFSKTSKTNAVEELEERLAPTEDSSLKKVRDRMQAECFTSEGTYDRLLAYHKFPFNEVTDKTDFLRFRYDIPCEYVPGNAPQLRFGDKYTFIMNQEYLNGWGLSLTKEAASSLELSVQELNEAEEEELYTPEKHTFVPLENKKEVGLYPRRKIEVDETKPMENRESLENLVVRSKRAKDARRQNSDRHILPAQIETETAWWHGLLSKLGPSKSYKLKQRANCAITSAEEFEDSRSRGNRCPEGCSSFCGNLHMNSHYPRKHMKPKYLTDPGMKGVNIELFWDKECTKPFDINKAAYGEYGGEKGIDSRSILLSVKKSDGETQVEINPARDEIDIALKKGAKLYARINNVMEGDHIQFLKTGSWVYDLADKRGREALGKLNLEKMALLDNPDDVVNERSASKVITLTHAVKEPLVMPEIKSLYSTPSDSDRIDHISKWLNNEYKVDSNIIADRLPEYPEPGADDVTYTTEEYIGASLAKLNLEAHFERLDAIDLNNLLDTVAPTGELELWMRKEEFKDDPVQYVFADGRGGTHLPSEAVIGFDTPRNRFSLEHKLEFTPELMVQLKDIRNRTPIDRQTDPYKAFVSQLSLIYDLNTTSYEEREYFLRDTSKFKGYFSRKTLNGTVDAEIDRVHEEFVLPREKDVMKDLGEDSLLRFKTIVLNNKPPRKPEVAFAVTTIDETRRVEDKDTTSIQKGNIVTIYLKRGRLSSGKNERIGLILDDSNCKYFTQYKKRDLFSRAGKDIVSDGFANDSVTIRPEHINIANRDYEAAYEPELGVMHYLPKFDLEKQLWKFEVELNITTANGKQMHNPFVNFSMVHFQPFSVNYNDPASPDLFSLPLDCRISEPINSAWCYLLPERKLAVSFDKPRFRNDKGEVKMTLSFDFESLHKAKDKFRTQFLLSVQGSNDRQIWEPVWSKTQAEDEFKPHHSLINREFLEEERTVADMNLEFTRFAQGTSRGSQQFKYFRVMLTEVEWFDNVELEWHAPDPIDQDELAKREALRVLKLHKGSFENEDWRVRYVELVY